MDESRRQALKARRSALRDRLALAPINDLVERLAERGCRAEVLLPGRCTQVLGELPDAPGKDERIDWDHIPTAKVRLWSSNAMRDRIAVKALNTCADPGSRVAIIWNSLEPGLAMSLEEIGDCIDRLLDAAPETWIVAAQGGKWLIECSLFDQEICWSEDLMRGIGQKV